MFRAPGTSDCKAPKRGEDGVRTKRSPFLVKWGEKNWGVKKSEKSLLQKKTKKGAANPNEKKGSTTRKTDRRCTAGRGTKLPNQKQRGLKGGQVCSAARAQASKPQLQSPSCRLGEWSTGSCRVDCLQKIFKKKWGCQIRKSSL